MLDLLPKNWKKYTLSELATIYNGNSISKKTKEERYTGLKVGRNYIATKDIGFDGTVCYENGIKIPYKETKFKTAPSGCVFVCSEGGSAGKKTAYITQEVCFGNKLYAIVDKQGLLKGKFLYYYTRYNQFYDQFKSLPASLMGGVNYRNFGNICIPVPPTSEQERIVARIEGMFTQLDAGVETLKKTKAQLAVYRQAVLKEAFEKAEGMEERLGDLCFFITKGTTPSKDKMHSENGDIPFIKVYNLTFDNSLDFTIDPTFVDKEVHSNFLARSIVFPGDVLMNIVGPPMGKVSIVPDTYPEWNINQAIARFRCSEKLNNKYLAYYLGYAGTIEKMKKQAKATAGQYNLTLEICRELTITHPNMETQKRVVYDIDTKISKCLKIEETVNEALQQSEAMRQSILKDAFEGRL